MIEYIQCRDCKHYYKYFKQITNDEGVIDFVTIPKCRLGHEIQPEGSIANLNCFEHR